MLDRALSDGRFHVVNIVSSVGGWTDVDAEDWTSVDGAAELPAAPVVVTLTAIETTGAAPAFILLRAADGDSTDDALYVPAGELRTFKVYNPDRAIETIAVYGTARVEAALI